jgi:hypothetical protein
VTIPPEALLAGYSGPIIDLAEGLRAVVRQAIPDRIEAVRPGWRLIGFDLPIGRRTAFFAWIMPEAIHVHLGFPQGFLLDDQAGRLGGAGEAKRARWLTMERETRFRSCSTPLSCARQPGWPGCHPRSGRRSASTARRERGHRCAGFQIDTSLTSKGPRPILDATTYAPAPGLRGLRPDLRSAPGARP